MIDINWKPTDRELRQFGLIFLGFSALLGAIFWWRWGPGPATWALWAAGPLVALVGLALPRALKPLYLGLTLVAYPIGLVVSNVLLGITYYLVVTPIGLVFRLLGRDPLHRRFNPEAKTYWIPRRPPASAGRYFRQF